MNRVLELLLRVIWNGVLISSTIFQVKILMENSKEFLEFLENKFSVSY